MQSFRKMVLFWVLTGVLLVSGPVFAQEQVPAVSEKKETPEDKALNLARVIPAASDLTARLAILQQKLPGLVDTASLERGYDDIAANLNSPAEQLTAFKDSGDGSYAKLLGLQKQFRQQKESFEKINKPLDQAVTQLDTWQKQWLAEQSQWSRWRDSLTTSQQFEPLESTFQQADETIAGALELVTGRLKSLLAVQMQAGNIQVQMKTMSAELETLVANRRYAVFFDASAPMFSREYMSQFSTDLWKSVPRGIYEIEWLDGAFFEQEGGVILIQLLAAAVLSITFYRNRKILQESDRWKFLA